MKTVFQEFDKDLGIQTRVHQGDGKTVFQKTYDAEPYLQYAQALREKTEGQQWGEGRVIGTVPEAVLSVFMRRGLKGKELSKALTAWVRENPAMICFDKFK